MDIGQSIWDFISKNPLFWTIPITAIGIPLFNYYIIKPHTEEKKAKLSKHHENIVAILKRWHDIKFELSDNKMDYPKISIPLYIDVIEKMRELDPVQHIEFHLRDKKYKIASDLYQSLQQLQNSHNNDVKESLPNFEEKIIGLISENAEFENQQIKELVLTKLFQYYDRVSKGNEIHLTSKLYEAGSGWFYRDIIPSDRPDDLIATGLNTEHDRIEKTRNLLDRNQEIETKLKKYHHDLTQFETSFEKFRSKINQIIHDAEILGVYGNCRIEEQLKLRLIFFQGLKSLFCRLNPLRGRNASTQK